MIIHTLPLIDKMREVNDKILNFKLTDGYSAETSGGLFVMVDPTRVDGFIRDHKEIYGQDVWVVGDVRRAQDPTKPVAKIREDFEVIQISESFL
jgi:selenide,water dikinase